MTVVTAWLSTPLCEDVATAVAAASSLPPLFVAVAVAVESLDCETEGTSVGPPPCWPPAVLTSTVLELPAPDWLADAPLCAFWEPAFATPAELPSSLDGCWLFVAVAVAEASFCWETPCSPPCPAEPLAGVVGAGGTTTTIVVVFCASFWDAFASLLASCEVAVPWGAELSFAEFEVAVAAFCWSASVVPVHAEPVVGFAASSVPDPLPGCSPDCPGDVAPEPVVIQAELSTPVWLACAELLACWSVP